MKFPAIRGTIRRRILANWRVDPGVLAAILPPPFRPKLVNGWGVAGVCLIRLESIRPTFMPPVIGLSSENAAHRIAVEWDDDGSVRQGVYIPRRDTDSRLNTLVGGRLFPGVHHHAHFDVTEENDRIELAMTSDDGRTRVSLAGHVADALPRDSVFGGFQSASDFFEAGSLGHSATRSPGRFDAMELHCANWSAVPFQLERVESSFFDSDTTIPRGAAVFDCALLMRSVEHEWRAREPLCCQTVDAAAESVAPPL